MSRTAGFIALTLACFWLFACQASAAGMVIARASATRAAFGSGALLLIVAVAVHLWRRSARTRRS